MKAPSSEPMLPIEKTTPTSAGGMPTSRVRYRSSIVWMIVKPRLKVVASPSASRRQSLVRTSPSTRCPVVTRYLSSGRAGAYGNRWCTYFRQKGSEFSRGCAEGGAGDRALLKSLTDDGSVPGLLAYRDGEPVGWVSVARVPSSAGSCGRPRSGRPQGTTGMTSPSGRSCASSYAVTREAKAWLGLCLTLP